MKKPLFHKDFTLLVIGQIISILGNSILRFSLSLYILDRTGSAAIFASILAFSLLPTILLSPIGGMISDRFSRKHIMVVLDFTTALLITLLSFAFAHEEVVLLLGGFMVVLSIIQSFYQPSVQASIPSLTATENLTAANGIVVQINALSTLAGPILGGLFYGFLGIYPICIIAMICFTISAILEIFLHIPFTKQERSSSLMRSIRSDFKESITFITVKNPFIFKLLMMIAGLNLLITALLQVGLPFIIKVQLGLSSQLYGFAESSLAIGMLIGSLLSTKFAKHLTIQTSYIPLFLGSICLLPIGLSILSLSYAHISYAIILLSILMGMSFIAMFNIQAQTFLQTQTPTHLLGKVTSFVTTISMCAVPIGQACYGICFDAFSSNSALIIMIASLCSILLAAYAKTNIKQLKEVCI